MTSKKINTKISKLFIHRTSVKQTILFITNKINVYYIKQKKILLNASCVQGGGGGMNTLYIHITKIIRNNNMS